MLAAYLPEERGAQDSMIYLVGDAKRLKVALRLFKLEHLLRKRHCWRLNFIADGYVV